MGFSLNLMDTELKETEHKAASGPSPTISVNINKLDKKGVINMAKIDRILKVHGFLCSISFISVKLHEHI